GYRYPYGSNNFGVTGGSDYWSGSASTNTDAWASYMRCNTEILQSSYVRTYGIGVRCVLQ
ncbi:MAG: fibrobacter succinogenes major paralogous domain-containing protein, partial [Dysgonamonadaceae bacterium]|nr:fibrobacter succinogenes major paralogous domain-containing protein [Dysgonamonadaceae bacterium]